MKEQDIITELGKMQKWASEGIRPAEDTEAYVSHIITEVVPLAEELGLNREQHELQELAVKMGYPEDYKYLKRLLQESEASCEMVFRTFALPIRAMLDEMGLDYDFKYRMKSVYSIWRKMRNNNKEFDDVYDLFATRIIYRPKDHIEPLPLAPENEVDSNAEVIPVKQWQLSQMDVEKFWCWRIYTIISMLYRIHPDRIRNWITHPKKSGYQALQMTVMGPDCNWIEIQIRSERMNYEAEQGVAAHWKYKQESKAM